MNQTHPTPDELIDYLHGELSPARDAAIHAHLAGCSECAEAREAELSLTEALRAHAKAQERELPSIVVTGIWNAVRRRPASLWERLSASLRPAISLPVAAAIALLLYFGLRGTHGTARAATVDAAYYLDRHATLSAITPFSEDNPVPAALSSDDETP